MAEESKSPFGNEFCQGSEGILAPEKQHLLELFSKCRIALIRSTRWKCHPQWYVPRRTVMNEFLTFVCDGEMEAETPYGKTVLRRGDFMLSPCGEFHAYGFRPEHTYVEHIIVHCQIHFPDFSLTGGLFSTPFLSVSNPDDFLERLMLLPCLWGERSPAARAYAENLLKGLLFELVVRDDIQVVLPEPLDHRAVQAINYMRESFAVALSVVDIANHVGLSETHFRKVFREQTNRAPLDYLTEIRLRHACVMLQNSNAKIGEVAERCGFNSVDYFCRIFKKYHGCTPTEYRLEETFF